MPSAVSGLSASASGSLIASAIGTSWSTVISPFFEPATLANNYAAWRNQPFVKPDVTTVISAFYKGYFHETAVGNLVHNFGIDLNADWYSKTGIGPQNANQNAWGRIFRSMEPPLLPDDAVRHFYMGDIGQDGLDWHLFQNGYNDPAIRRLVQNPRQLPPLGMIMNAANRQDITLLDWEDYLNASGYTHRQEKDLIEKQLYQIPGPADLISFAVREVFDPAIVSRFNYDAEFPQSFQLWMDKQGMGWKPSDAGYAVPAAQDITWPRAYWRSHWQMMSPTQASFAVHYLRPAKAGSTESRIPGVSAFTQADFDTILRIADYPPIIRNYLYGLSFSPLTRVDVRRMRRMGIMTDEEVFEAFRDIGYSEENARRLVAFTAEEARRVDNGRDRARMETIIRDTYSNGLITPGEAARWLFMLRKTSPDEQEKFRSLPEAEQETQALARPEIRLLLETITLGKQAKIAKSVLRATRASYLRREISADQARLLMQNVGVEQQDISLNLQLWSVEQTIKGKPATQAQVITWLKRGAINAQEAVQRLVNMGVSSRDINIILGLTSQDISLAAAKEQEKLFKTGREARRAQEQQLREMAANRRRIMADINKSASRETILRWLKKRLITPLEAYQAIVKRGTFPTDAVIYVAEVAQQLGEEYVKQIAEIQAEAEKANPVATGLEPSSNGVQQQSKEVP